MNKESGAKVLPQASETYDKMFEAGGYAGAYDLPYGRSPYYPLYKSVLKEIRRSKATDILEVGCGTGGFAHMLMDRTDLPYRGFDFSGVAVEKAIRRTGREDLFHVADASLAETYPAEYQTVVCTEVLEHVPEDRKIIGYWKKGITVICSIPNYDSPYHVRYFLKEAEIYDRYGDLIDIERVRRVKKPVVDDLALDNRLRQLRWNRWRPRRLAELLGMGDFDKVGGWFVVTGKRK